MHDPTAAADGFVLAMLGAMLLSFATVALAIGCGLRNAARRNPYVDELIDEVSEAEKQKNREPIATEATNPTLPWEREGDWWKK